jgi:hypothetical protein
LLFAKTFFQRVASADQIQGNAVVFRQLEFDGNDEPRQSLHVVARNTVPVTIELRESHGRINEATHRGPANQLEAFRNILFDTVSVDEEAAVL